MPTPSPRTVSATYRSLRKALEGSKDEPGAADFYHGEMDAAPRIRADVGGAVATHRVLADFRIRTTGVAGAGNT